jgi:hypothetical protein
VNFANDPFSVPPDGAIITDKAGDPIAGDAGWAQLYAGPDADSLAPIGQAVNFLPAGSGFEGFFSGGALAIPSVAPGANAEISVRAWLATQGTSWEQAVASGDNFGWSNNGGTFTVATGGAGSPPSLPANLVGMEAFQLIPEPSTTALGIIGAFALLLRRRK